MPNKPTPYRTEVLIIGGGVIGLSIARQLHRSGLRDITVIDKRICGREASWAAAGMLSPQAEMDQAGPFFDLCSRSRDLYPQFADAILRETEIDIELDRTGTLYLLFSDEDSNRLQARYNWQRAAGLEVQYLSRNEALRLDPNISAEVRGALLFPGDWQVDNRRLVQALSAYARLNGLSLIENTAVDHLVLENDRVIGARTPSGTINAASTVLCAGAWTSQTLLTGLPTSLRIEPVKGQIVCLETSPGTLRHVVYTHRGYLVPRRDGRVLVGSTTEHTGFDHSTAESAISTLTDLASNVLPNARLKMTDAWAGLRPWARDGLPLLGSIPGIDGLTVATAHYRNGILLTPLTASIVADKIVNGAEDAAIKTFGLERLTAATGASN